MDIQKIDDGACLDTINQVPTTTCDNSSTYPTLSGVDFFE
ncbi:hypothetical protein MCEMSHM24_02380 [Comamonadaceae bacterium]|jgi:hypothetical protein